eukprot:COSAG05_NODE_557_length_8701_cov_28.619972_7_plen_559_part_00
MYYSCSTTRSPAKGATCHILFATGHRLRRRDHESLRNRRTTTKLCVAGSSTRIIRMRGQLAPHVPLSEDELLAALSSHYGAELEPINYVRGIGVCARLRHSQCGNDEAPTALDRARELAASLPPASELKPVSASALAFLEELAVHSASAEGTLRPLVDFAQRYLDEADTDTGRAEGLLNEGNWTEDLFFAGVILGRAFHATSRQEFADMLCHLLLSNNNQQPSGLWFHADHSLNAWSRGNGFAAAGYAEALHYLPSQHPRYAELAERHNRHLRALIQHQAADDGTWHQLVDDPTSFHELTSAGLIGYAITRALQGGWLQDDDLVVAARTCVDRAFLAVCSRIDAQGRVKGGCQSTGPLPSREAYRQHPILDGVRDDRSGSVCYWFAVEYVHWCRTQGRSSTARGVVPGTAGSMVAEQQAFRRDGYVVVRGLFTAAEVALMRRVAEADIALHADGMAAEQSYTANGTLPARTISQGDGSGGKTAFWVDDNLSDDYYSAVACSVRVVDRMELFLGEEVYHWHHKLMLKHALSDDGVPGGAFRWHQDFVRPRAPRLPVNPR